MKYKVGVIFGGESVEHEISILSAHQAMAALDTIKYDVIPLYVAKNRQIYFGEWLKDLEKFKDLDNLISNSTQVCLVKQQHKVLVIPIKNRLFSNILSQLDIIVPIVHGTNCEDGTIQGYIEMLKVPYVGSGVISSAVGQDKVFMKQILCSNNIPLIDWTWFYSKDYDENPKVLIKNLEKQIKYPLIIKPANLGSSVGISSANNATELTAAINLAKQFDQKIVVERKLERFTEYNCSILGNHNNCTESSVEEIVKADSILTYDDKYLSGNKTKGMANTSRIIPARLTSDKTMEVKELARKSFIALDASGVVRVDLIFDHDEQKFYVNEINMIPGSLAFYLWSEVGVSFPDLMDRLIEIALENHRIKEKLTFSYTTNVLSQNRGIKGIKK